MAIIQDILSGRDLYVVLENRFGKPYVEAYNLTTVLLQGDRFWAKFRNHHSPFGHKRLKADGVLSYAYNNFTDIVCTMSLNKQLHKFYSSFAYSSLVFHCKNTYSQVWDNINGGDIKDIEKAVRSANNIKLMIENQDGLIFIMPAHTVEVYQSDGEAFFSMQSEYDGIPEMLTKFPLALEVDKQIKNIANTVTTENYVSTDFFGNKPYYSLSFIIMGDSVWQRVIGENGELVQQAFDTKSFKVFVEEK